MYGRIRAIFIKFDINYIIKVKIDLEQYYVLRTNWFMRTCITFNKFLVLANSKKIFAWQKDHDNLQISK